MSSFSFEQLNRLRAALFDTLSKEAPNPQDWKPRLDQEYNDYYASKHQGQLAKALVLSIFAGLLVGIAFQLVAPASLLSFGYAVFGLVPLSGFLLSLAIMVAPVILYYVARSKHLENKLAQQREILDSDDFQSAADECYLQAKESQKLYALIALTNSLFHQDNTLSVEAWCGQSRSILGECSDQADTKARLSDFSSLHAKLSPEKTIEKARRLSDGQAVDRTSPQASPRFFLDSALLAASVKGDDDAFFEAHQERIGDCVEQLNAFILDQTAHPEHATLCQQLNVANQWVEFRDQRFHRIKSIPLGWFSLTSNTPKEALPENASELLEQIRERAMAYNRLQETQRYVSIWRNKYALQSDEEPVLIDGATNSL